MHTDTDETFRRKRNLSWWKRRTNTERIGICLLIIAALIIIVLIIAIGIAVHKTKKEDDDTEKNKEEAVCLTPGCVNAAAIILQSIDETVNPCDDFYQFACSRYIKENTIPDDKPRISHFATLADVVQRQLRTIFEEPIKHDEPKPFVLVKKLYNLCMNTSAIEEDGLNTIERIIKETGGWPVLDGPNWKEDDFDWKTSTYKFRKLGLSMGNFISFSIMPDARNSSLRMLALDQPKLDIAMENLIDGFENEVVTAYQQYMIDFAVLFGADRTIAEVDVKSMIEFKMEIAKISLSQEERRDVNAIFNPMTIAELQSTFQSIPWLELIDNVIHRPEKSVTSMEEINIVVPRYIEELEKLLFNSSKRSQANYAFFQTIRALVDYLPQQIREKEQQYTAKFLGTSAEPPRWFNCVLQVSENLHIAAGALYVRRHFDDETKQSVSEIVSDVRKELIKIMEKLEWMDSNTKKIAIDKALSMRTHIGYPSELLDDKKIEEFYAELNFTNDNYLETLNEIQLFKSDSALGELKDPINHTDWKTRISTIDINAGYSLHQNSIELSASILQGMFYDKNRPHYMNYGSAGYIIGHEITHGFDDQGRQYNKMGGLENWWANETNNAYAERAKCFVKQYNDILVPEVKLHLDGENTQNENIADNGAVKEAYLAYDSWVKRNGPEPKLPGLNYTPKQLFWIATANCWCTETRNETLESSIFTDEHSPPRYRINIPFGNTRYFAEDFNCGAGSKMIPKQNCQIW